VLLFDKYGNDILSQRKRLKLGLDLQGGMYVIMEVDIRNYFRISQKRQIYFNQALQGGNREAKANDADFVETFEAKLRSKGSQ
jgi:preprotein translocase subunit SecD